MKSFWIFKYFLLYQTQRFWVWKLQWVFNSVILHQLKEQYISLPLLFEIMFLELLQKIRFYLLSRQFLELFTFKYPRSKAPRAYVKTCMPGIHKHYMFHGSLLITSLFSKLFQSSSRFVHLIFTTGVMNLPKAILQSFLISYLDLQYSSSSAPGPSNCALEKRSSFVVLADVWSSLNS